MPCPDTTARPKAAAAGWRAMAGCGTTNATCDQRAAGPASAQLRLDITRGAPRPPDSTLTLRAQTLLDVLAGRTDFGTLQLTGALRVEGDPAAQMMLGAIVTGFKTQARARGLRGQLTRAFGRWLGAHAQPERTAT